MNVMEAQSWLLDKSSPHIIAIIAKLDFPLDIAQLHIAAEQVAARNPVLSYYVSDTDNQLLAHHEKHFMIKKIHHKSWQTIVNQQINRRFVAGECLLKIFFSDAQRPFLLLFIPHSIGDGMSATVMLQQLLSVIKQPELPMIQGKKKSSAHSHIPAAPSLSLLQGKNGRVPINHDKTLIKSLRYTQKQSEQILASCKAEKISLTDLFSAVSAKVNQELLSNADKVNLYIPVDMRKHHYRNAQYLSHQTSWVEFSTQVSQKTFPLARKIRRKVSKCITEQQPIKNIEVIKDELEHMSAQQVIEANQRQSPTVVVSGLSIMPDFSGLGVLQFFMATNCQAYIARYPSFMLTFNLLNNRIFFSVLCVSPQLSSSMEEKIIHAIQERMLLAS